MRVFITAGCLLLLHCVMLAQAASGPSTTPSEQIAPFKIVASFTAGDQEISTIIYFLGKSAVEFEDDAESEPVVVYDLSGNSWRDISPARVVKLSDCEAWAKATLERSKASLAKTEDGNLRRFAEGMLDPKFVVTAEEGRLKIANDVVQYDIRSEQSLSKAQRNLFYAYDKLNAYRKAMVDRKLPPFPQLAVTKELAAREMVPVEMKMVLRSPKGEMRADVKIEVQALTADEQRRVEAVINEQSAR